MRWRVSRAVFLTPCYWFYGEGEKKNDVQLSLQLIFVPCFGVFWSPKAKSPSILPQSVSSLGENADKELSRLVGSIGGGQDDVVSRVQMQLPPHTPEGQS